VYKYTVQMWRTASTAPKGRLTVTPMDIGTHIAPVSPLVSLHGIRPSGGPEITLRVLGEVEAVGPCGTFAPGRTRPGALLAMLAMHAGECVAVDRIIDELWPAQTAAPGVKRVQVNVVRLRRALAQVAPGADPGTIIRTRSCGYSLEIDPERIDAVRFGRLVTRGRAELDARDPARAAASLREALALWRGDPYADHAYEAFAAPEIGRLEEVRACALEAWAEAELARGAHATMAPELQRLVSRHPLRERLRALLMVALYRCCRQGEALAAYHAARRALVDGLGIEPGSELRELQRAILEQSPALELRPPGAVLTMTSPRLAQAA
jgi:DNA-binding SARP family transcriptional activator